ERWQLLLELVVAGLKSKGRCAPVGLFTNLNNYWCFLAFLGSHLPLKRQKLLRGATGCNDAVAESLERYEFMSNGLSPQFL
ncbi:Hypothetical protein PHPALM_18993, partial [Phytophthora palmivora]